MTKTLNILIFSVVLFAGQMLAQTSPVRSLPCTGERDVTKVKMLLDSGFGVDSTIDACIELEPAARDVTLLMLAAADGKTELVELLLAKGANINAKNSYGGTPLAYAVRYQKPEMMRLLIEKGADVNSRGMNQTTILMTAASIGNLPIIELLLAHGADVRARDKNKVTALMYAAAEKQIEAMTLLVARGAGKKAKDRHGRRANTYLKKGFPREYLILLQ